jgi:hypothetical protein
MEAKLQVNVQQSERHRLIHCAANHPYTKYDKLKPGLDPALHIQIGRHHPDRFALEQRSIRPIASARKTAA